MIRKAEAADIDAVEQGYIELLTYEKANGGHSNWQLGVYPTRELAQRELEAGNLYVLEEDGLVCASMRLNREQGVGYENIDWIYPAGDDEVFVVHTLCVPPSFARRGAGKRMMLWALDEARRRGGRVMRLDTDDGNSPATGLYLSLGFRIAGIQSVMLEGLIPEVQKFFEIEL
ncbi:MAG: GNAT family N-acetyltransferase [Candidatus Heteroscillospira sp.]